MYFTILLCVGTNGFQFTSDFPCTHFVTINGTLNGLSSSEMHGPLTSIPELTVESSINISGTVITVIIEANQAATFDCQFDDQDVVPCK